jgi:hypothetical protein
MAMKGEIFVEFIKTMFKKLIKTKVIVKKNVNFMLNLFYSYDIPHRNERYPRRSLENGDKKLASRRNRKTHRSDGVVNKKVSNNYLLLLSIE